MGEKETNAGLGQAPAETGANLRPGEDTAAIVPGARVVWKQGFLGVVFPEEAGGMGLGYVELAALAEEMGRALVPGAFLSNLFVVSLKPVHGEL